MRAYSCLALAESCHGSFLLSQTDRDRSNLYRTVQFDVLRPLLSEKMQLKEATDRLLFECVRQPI